MCCRPDPTLLAAALEALALEAPQLAGAFPEGMLVGDSELATTGNAQQDASMPQHSRGAEFSSLQAAASSRHLAAAPATAGLLSSSYDAGRSVAGGQLPSPVLLGGSAPAGALDWKPCGGAGLAGAVSAAHRATAVS